MEEGKGNEKWYISCVDLLKSRFHADEMAVYGISDLQIKRVIRIHNRFLRFIIKINKNHILMIY